ncbi:hypothetical protein MTO96_032211 [Rhipicephalus appendiculatus]
MRKAVTVDLTQNFTNETVYWQPGYSFHLDIATYPGPPGDEWRQLDNISEATHGGTHIDAPLHFARDGWSVAEIPIERLMYLPIVKLDVRPKTKTNPEYIITLSDIRNWEKRYGRVPDGCLFLFETGQCRFWPNRTTYMGLDENGDRHFPSLDPEAASFLASERRPYGFGLDGPSLDHYPNVTVHQIVAASSLYATENLACSISRVPATGATGIVLPMKIPGASGAPRPRRRYLTLTTAATAPMHHLAESLLPHIKYAQINMNKGVTPRSLIDSLTRRTGMGSA